MPADEGSPGCGKVNAEEPPQVDHKSVTQLDSLSLSETRAPAYALAHVNEGIRWVSRHTNRTIASGRTNTDSGHADRKSTRLNSSHSQISYAVFCLKKKTRIAIRITS